MTNIYNFDTNKRRKVIIDKSDVSKSDFNFCIGKEEVLSNIDYLVSVGYGENQQHCIYNCIYNLYSILDRIDNESFECLLVSANGKNSAVSLAPQEEFIKPNNITKKIKLKIHSTKKEQLEKIRYTFRIANDTEAIRHAILITGFINYEERNGNDFIFNRDTQRRLQHQPARGIKDGTYHQT